MNTAFLLFSEKHPTKADQVVVFHDTPNGKAVSKAKVQFVLGVSQGLLSCAYVLDAEGVTVLKATHK